MGTHAEGVHSQVPSKTAWMIPLPAGCNWVPTGSLVLHADCIERKCGVGLLMAYAGLVWVLLLSVHSKVS